MAYTPIVPYADVAYGDAYFADRLGADAWTGANKEKALKQATQMIDLLPLVGTKYDETQANQFPRSCDENGVVPDEVMQACCEVAIALLEGKTVKTMSAAVGVVAERVGDSSTEYAEGGRGGMALYDEAYGLPSITAAQLLAPWLEDMESIDITRE